MAFSKLTASLAVAALSALPYASASSHMIMGGLSPIAYQRIDPIVNHGAVSTHVHALVGANNMNANSDYDSVRTADCTSVPFQNVDKSVYWAPPVYYQDQATKKLSLMPSTFNIYYFFDRNGPGEKVHAFPAGLQMVAGSPTRTTYNASSFADQAVSFVCLDYSGAVSNNPAYAERKDIHFPDVNACKNGIRWQIFFPQCWDGVNLDSADHKSHMAYPIDNYNGGSCPPSHPVHTVGIFYEMMVPVDQYPYWGDGAYVLSTGNTDGLQFHADFLSGWEVDVLQDAVDNCHNMNGDINACQVLQPYIDQDAAHACTVNAQIVNEDVGLTGNKLSALPGCNPIKTAGSTTAATCPAQAAPGFMAAVETLVPGWTEIGCIAEGTNGRALTAASTTSPQMTKNVCANFCAGKGYQYAGIEFGDECYCGNSFSNGASANTVSWDQCNSACAGNPTYEKCGGPQRLTLLKAGAAPPPSSPSVVPTSVRSSSAVVTTSSPAVVKTSSVVVSSSVVLSHSQVLVQTSVSPAKPTSPPSGPAKPINGDWISVGCGTDGSKRALTGYSYTAVDMTADSCIATCESKGYSMAGIEFGVECYCGNSLENGLGGSSNQCTMACGGSNSQTCGGNWAISLFKDTAAGSAPAPPTTPTPSPVKTQTSTHTTAPVSPTAAWVSAGCAADGSARALTGYMFSSDKMTTSLCLTTCASKGFTIGGIEFGKECYCGNELSNKLGYQIDAGRQCYMTCSGAPNEKCGGTWALSLYQVANQKRSKHFGRQHQYRSAHF